MIYGTEIKDRAFAKINLFLDVTGKRSDGYHNICSIMQSVSLCDDISVSLCRENTDTLTCSIPDIPTDSKNLAIKAANAFRRETGFDFGTVMHIEKNIPFAAGLAGGSSDAASVLRCLRKLSGIKVDDDKMIAIAASVGADVPFCLAGGTMLTEGIGDRLTSLPKCPKLHCVIAIKGEGVSTPVAYGMLDEKYGDYSNQCHRNSVDIMLKALKALNTTSLCDGMFNIFESVIEPIRPSVGALKNIMKANGAEKTLMSGSGPSVFGIFSAEASALSAVTELKKNGAEAYYCTTV